MISFVLTLSRVRLQVACPSIEQGQVFAADSYFLCEEAELTSESKRGTKNLRRSGQTKQS